MDSEEDRPFWGETSGREARPYPGGGQQQPYPGQPPYPGAQPYGPPMGTGHPAFGPPMGTGRPKVRPGRIWYLGGLALLLGGVAWLIAGLISVSNQVNSFPRVPLPAGGTVTLNHSGHYVIYYEGTGAADGLIPAFNVRIAAVAPPAEVGSLHGFGNGSVSYTIGSRQGTSVLNLQITHAGRFLVQTSGVPTVPSGSDLAFGPDFGGALLAVVLPSIGLILAGIAALIILAIVRSTRIRRARTAAMSPAAPSIDPWQSAQ
jgi:hypothetical protein